MTIALIIITIPLALWLLRQWLRRELAPDEPQPQLPTLHLNLPLKRRLRVDCARPIVAYATRERTPWPRATPNRTTPNSLSS